MNLIWSDMRPESDLRKSEFMLFFPVYMHRWASSHLCHMGKKNNRNWVTCTMQRKYRLGTIYILFIIFFFHSIKNKVSADNENSWRLSSNGVIACPMHRTVRVHCVKVCERDSWDLWECAVRLLAQRHCQAWRDTKVNKQTHLLGILVISKYINENTKDQP